MNYFIFAKFIAWIFPTKQDRRNFREFCKEIDSRKISQIIHKNYEKVIQNLSKKDKFKVVFLNTQNSKWAYQSLYEELKNDPKFEILILISTAKTAFKEDSKKYENQANDSFEFFKKQKMNVDFLADFSKKKFKNLKDFKPDIVFYEQPWDLPKDLDLLKISKYALCFYVSYGSSITEGKNEYIDFLYRYFCGYFVDNENIQKQLSENTTFKKSIIFSGHLKLDNYLKPLDEDKILWKSKNKRVIWAPHHSFYADSMLKFGTFDWNYNFFYEFAKNHPEIEFIVKPHPLLKEQIVNKGLMSLKDMQDYFDKWQNLQNVQVYECGNYFDMFKASDLLITDCNSFLYEYLPTLKPCIRLINKNSISHNDFGKKIISGYYEAKNLEDLQNLIDLILFKEKDEFYEKREKIVKNDLIWQKNSVANFIKNYILNLIKGKI